MDTLIATMINAMAPDGHEKVFDWDKAATILKENNPKIALAGLEGDFENTGGIIWINGEPVIDDDTFLASRWATPILVTDYDEFPCFLPKDESGFDAYPKWPKSALKIIEKARKEDASE